MNRKGAYVPCATILGIIFILIFLLGSTRLTFGEKHTDIATDTLTHTESQAEF